MTIQALLATPEAWTKYVYARDKSGRITFAQDPEAVSFCLLGALRKVYPDNFSENKKKIKEAVRKLYGPEYKVVSAFNDDDRTTHADVMRVVREAGV